MKNPMKAIVFAFLMLLGYSATSLAVSPWFGEEGDRSISATYVSASYDEFWKAGAKTPGPGREGVGIEQQTLWLHYDQHIADDMSYSLTTGFTQSRFAPATRGNFNGIADSLIDIKYLLFDEFSSDVGYPTVSVRAGLILAGTYPLSTKGNVHAPGDKASGVETSLLLGKLLFNRVSISGELGYRYRNNGVPQDLFSNIGVSYQFVNGWRLDSLYSMTNAQSGTDIEGPGFSPSEFEKLKEERTSVGIGLFLPIGDTQSLGLNYVAVIKGRNTGKSKVFNLTYVFGFSDY